MNEDIRRVRPAGCEPISLAPVEPFNRRLESRARGFGSLAQVSGIPRWRSCRIIQQEKTPGLQPLRALHRFADDARAFVRRLESRLADAGLVQKNVPGRAAPLLYESIALGLIKPLHQARDFEPGLARTKCGHRPPVGAHQVPHHYCEPYYATILHKCYLRGKGRIGPQASL